MEKAGEIVLIYATYPTVAAAEAGARLVLERRLAACANILPGMLSIFRWQGAVQQDSEVVMIIKTRVGLAEGAIAAARAIHPYETSAFLILPVAGGNMPFLDWIMAETSPMEGAP